MTQIAIVVFREVLEIALILGILSAATKEIKGRTQYILGGLGFGVLSAILLAFFTDKISESINGMGQEIFNGSILLLAAAMISATIIWMNKHAKSISGNLRLLSDDVKDGKKPLFALLIVVFLSVLREGAEIVLFTYSYFVSGTSALEIFVGLVIGIICGIITGFAFYFGILKISGKYFLKVTSYLLAFFAAGIAMQGVGFLINADIIPAIMNPAFDASNVLSQTSYLGKFLNMFFGYIDNPTGAQLFTYLFVLFSLIFGLKRAK